MARKGQAAMEYLMTYGWALLVIVIVIAILLVILGRMVKGTPDCTFESAGFVCNQPTPPQLEIVVQYSSRTVNVCILCSSIP